MIDLLTDSLFFIFLFWVFISPVICFFLARSRNRSTLFWVIAGFVFGLISIIMLYLLPKLEKKYYADNQDRVDSKIKMYEHIKEFTESKQNQHNK